MYLTLVNRPESARATYALSPDMDKAYPKKAGEIAVLVNGKEEKMAITGSRNYAVKSDAGNNGWIRLPYGPEGKIRVFWILFDAGYSPFTERPEFTLHDGKAPDANPVRAPKNPAGELARRKNLSDALRARSGPKPADEAAVIAELIGDGETEGFTNDEYAVA